MMTKGMTQRRVRNTFVEPRPHPMSQNLNKSFLAAAPESWHPELSGHQPCFFPLCMGIFLTDFQIDNRPVTHTGVILYGSGFKCHVITPYGSYSTEQI